MKKKKALIFGITGQDGFYLTDLLLKKKYIVHGVVRKSSSINTTRLNKFYKDPHESKNFFLHYGDLLDIFSIQQVVKKTKPDEIYNLAAQSHVGTSFNLPEYTSNVNGLGALRILEAIKDLNLINKTKFYQAGTSEMFGASKAPQDEKTSFQPSSPYAIAKLFGHWITVNYREAYKIFACNGILFNHESSMRGETFVTKKIIKGLVRILKNKQKVLYLGNLYSKRDWGHAKDYVFAMWLMLQQRKPDDYVISTGKNYSIKYFINKVAKKLNMKIQWRGKKINEVAIFKNKVIIKIDKKYFRPKEVEDLKGISKYAYKKLQWKPRYNIDMLIDEMISHEIKNVE